MVSEMFHNRRGAIATMHRKEQVMAPILEQELGIQIVVPSGLNTDVFGTFTRDIPRSGTQIEAARLKARRALELAQTSLAFASEGTFGPHPAMPLLPCNRELVLLLDLDHGLELVGEALSTETNFNHQSVTSVEAALAFAETVGFPDHGLVVRVDAPDGTSAEGIVAKGLVQEADLVTAVERAIATSGIAHLETDMRAMVNPSRMTVIAEATRDLVRKVKRTCPDCGWPGFDVARQLPGLPCGLCGLPTALVHTEVYQCRRCGLQKDQVFPRGATTADPAHCGYCNP